MNNIYKYYHEETNNPYSENRQKAMFWNIEKMYFQHEKRYSSTWVEYLRIYESDNNGLHNILTDKTISENKRALTYYMTQMLLKWQQASDIDDALKQY